MRFPHPLCFDDCSLQKYRAGSQGISPHRDPSSINLICIFTICGQCRFCLCDDRQGRGAIELDATPGNVIIMRAPGYMNSDVRPFHFVTDVKGPRISFALRQRQDA